MQNMLYVTNKDVPGLIGSLGNILGDEEINIASFNLGRTGPLEDAIALIGVDKPVSEKVIKEVEKLKSVVQVKCLNFKII
jgi:D-3-phosphoglycerate dehydrogenase